MLYTITINTTELKKVQESLYFLCLYINRAQTEYKGHISEEVQQLLLETLENKNVLPLTKDLVLITQYEQLVK